MAAPTFQDSDATTFDTGSTAKTLTVEVGNGWRLVAYALTEDEAFATTISDSIGYTWTLVEDATADDYGRVQIWTATAHVAASPAMDLTFTPSPVASRHWGGGVLLYSNSDGFGAAEKAAGSGAPSLDITTGYADSALVTAVSDWSAVDGTTRTWRTVNGSAMTGLVYQRDAAAATFYVGRRDNAGVAGLKTTGLSAPAGQKFQIASVEVLGVAPEFPKTGILDAFTRADATPPGAPWGGLGIASGGATGIGVLSNQLRYSDTNDNNGHISTSYGPNSEAYCTVATLPPDGEYVALFSRLTDINGGNWGGYYLVWIKGATTDTYSIRKRVGNVATTLGNPTAATLTAGQKIGLSVVGTTIKVWKGVGSTWTQVGTVTDSDITGAGPVGIEISTTGTRVDDFGGGTISAGPSAPANAGAPVLSGAPVTASTLTCSTGTWTGDPTPTYTYQWKRNNVAISGATSSTYVLTVTDEDQSIKCTVTATNSQGSAFEDSNTVTPSAGGVTFPLLGVLDNFNRADAQPPGGSWATTGVDQTNAMGLAVASNQLRFVSGGSNSINGYLSPDYGPELEQYCTVATLPANGDYIGLFSRLRNVGGGNWEGLLLVWIKGATNDTWSVRKRFDGTTTTITSPTSPTIAAGDKIGWSASGSTVRLFKNTGGVWVQVGANITGFPEITWGGKLGIEIPTATIRVDDFGGGTVAFAPTNTAAPALSGVAETDSSLTCSTGSWSAAPAPTYTYQWKRAGANISGATGSSYLLVPADVSQAIKCTVTATNASGSASADSNTVTPVSAPPTPSTTLLKIGGQWVEKSVKIRVGGAWLPS